MSTKRAVKNARRKARAAKRANPRPSDTDCRREPSQDGDLGQLLVGRGWTVFDRAARGTMYDWPPSADDASGEVTYLIVDEREVSEAGRYRVSCVDGQRRTYDDADRLIAELDQIEALRA